MTEIIKKKKKIINYDCGTSGVVFLFWKSNNKKNVLLCNNSMESYSEQSSLWHNHNFRLNLHIEVHLLSLIQERHKYGLAH